MTQKRLLFISSLILVLLVFTIGTLFAQDAATANAKTVKVLRTNNKAQVLGYVPKVYTFNKVNPHEVVNFFTSALMTEEGGCFSFVSPEGNSGKILVICPDYQIPYFDQLAKDLDRTKLTSAPGSKYTYYRFKHRNPLDAGLLSVLSSYSKEVLWPDVETNSLLLFDSPGGAERGEKALAEILDIPTPMVQVELKVYEVNTNNNAAMGLDYVAWKNGPGKSLFKYGYDTDSIISSKINNITATKSNFGYYVDMPSAYFDFLVSKNKAKSVVNTKLTSVNGNKITFSTGDQVLYFSKYATTDANGIITSANNLIATSVAQSAGSTSLLRTVNTDKGASKITSPAGAAVAGTKTTVNGAETITQPVMIAGAAPAIQGVATGIGIEITPTIGSERVNMDILVRVADLVGYQDSGTPIISSRQMDDFIMAPYDTEVMIGNLSREYIVKTTKKFPILGSIPGMGWLFGGENQLKKKSTAIVSIKANVLKDLTNITAEDKKIIGQVVQNAETPSPEPIYGFDQWLLDNEK